MGIKFFRKNRIDLDFANVTLTVTDASATDDGADFLTFLRNRENTSGWATTDSQDSYNTQLDIDMTDERDIDTIILVENNFKAYTIQYWNGSTYTDFSTAINESNNTETTKEHQFNTVSTSKIRIIITGTMVADADKFMTQLILTEELGEFSFQPRVKPLLSKNRKSSRYLSGKAFITRMADSFAVSIEFQNVTGDTDLTLMETLFDSYEGFLIWLCGGTTTQFTTIRKTWRKQDIFLCNLLNEYEPEWEESRYANGMGVKLEVAEIV